MSKKFVAFKVPSGSRWKDQSCALDSVTFSLVCAFSELNTTSKQQFTREMRQPYAEAFNSIECSETREGSFRTVTDRLRDLIYDLSGEKENRVKRGVYALSEVFNNVFRETPAAFEFPKTALEWSKCTTYICRNNHETYVNTLTFCLHSSITDVCLANRVQAALGVSYFQEAKTRPHFCAVCEEVCITNKSKISNSPLIMILGVQYTRNNNNDEWETDLFNEYLDNVVKTPDGIV